MTSTQPVRWQRVLDATAGVLSAGALALGVVLAGLTIVVPAVTETGTGPGWPVSMIYLAVGGAAEAIRGVRQQLSGRVRWVAAAAVVLVVLVVIVATR